MDRTGEGERDRKGDASSKEMERFSKEIVLAGLQQTTGLMGPGNERAITLARLKSLIPTDKDYSDLIRNLEEKLPWGETCKEYRQQKKHISVCDGVALYNDR